MKEQVGKAVEVLKRGGLILYPTDTIWGIGCDATNPEAVEKVYRLKKSHDKKSMLVLVDSIDKVSRYVKHIPEVAWQILELSDKPLTLILPGACGLAENLIPEEGTLGIRIPNHEFCHAMLRRFGRPVVSTSANISEEPAPSVYHKIDKEILAGVDMVVDPVFEKGASRAPSSIVQLGMGGEITIIRE